jgi:hypothetical protein
MSSMLTFEEANALLNYNPETGIFTWKITRGNKVKAGGVAGYSHPSGYTYIGILNKTYSSHRIAWLLYYEQHPLLQIDHIDRNRGNNAISNLREVGISTNNSNKEIKNDNLSGYTGVYKSKYGYSACIHRNNNRVHLGYFKTAKEASEKYLQARISPEILNLPYKQPKKIERHSPEDIKKLLEYDVNTGNLYWKTKPLNRKTNLAGHTTSAGYININISGRIYKSHHVVWVIYYGEFPDVSINVIDHINGIKNDNRIGNLRLVSKSKNSINTSIYLNNTSGIKGVCHNKSKNRWEAYISAGGKRISLGTFKTIEGAISARKEAELIYHV